MITPLFVLFSKTILTQEVTMNFYFLINCSTSLYNRPSTSITLFRTIHYMQIAVVGLVGFVIADEALLLHQVQNGALALLGGF